MKACYMSMRAFPFTCRWAEEICYLFAGELVLRVTHLGRGSIDFLDTEYPDSYEGGLEGVSAGTEKDLQEALVCST